MAAEARQGYELWRSLTTVVCLTVSVRAPGLLGRIQAEMRQQTLSDDSWALLQSRVLGFYMDEGKVRKLPEGQPDPRLSQTPFSDHAVQYIVHRHTLRASQAFKNCIAACVRERLRLYTIVAADCVADKGAHRFTDDVRTQSL